MDSKANSLKGIKTFLIFMKLLTACAWVFDFISISSRTRGVKWFFQIRQMILSLTSSPNNTIIIWLIINVLFVIEVVALFFVRKAIINNYKKSFFQNVQERKDKGIDVDDSFEKFKYNLIVKEQKFINGFLAFGRIIGVILSIINLLIFISWGGAFLGTIMTFIGLFAIWGVIGIFMGMFSSSSKSDISSFERMKDMDDYDKYKKRREKESADYKKRQTEQRQKEYERKQEIKAAQHPQCPMCHGNNTERITTVDRAVSVGTLGIASNKVGKQFHCRDCKYNW